MTMPAHLPTPPVQVPAERSAVTRPCRLAHLHVVHRCAVARRPPQLRQQVAVRQYNMDPNQLQAAAAVNRRQLRRQQHAQVLRHVAA